MGEINLEVGKFYKTVGGAKVKVLSFWDDTFFKFQFSCEVEYIDCTLYIPTLKVREMRYNLRGETLVYPTKFNIVSEWEEGKDSLKKIKTDILDSEIMNLNAIKLILAIFCLIGIWGSYLLFSPYRTTVKYSNLTNKQEMVSLKTESNVSGSFFLGTGSIKEDNYYYFFLKDSLSGGFVKHKIPSENVLIIEKDTVPSLITNYAIVKSFEEYLFKKDTIITKIFDYDSFKVREMKKEKHQYILIIPFGSITKKVSWDAL